MEKKTRDQDQGSMELPELQKGAKKKGVHMKYSKLPIPQALETARQRLTALDSLLKRYTREIKCRWINQLYSIEPYKVYSQWQ